MSPAVQVKVARLVVSAEVDGALVVMDEAMRFFELDAMGREIWQRIGVGSDTYAIARSIATIYAVDVATAQRDIEEFVGQLAAEHLVVIGEEFPTEAFHPTDDE
jgi:hypothetical protein